MQYFSVSAESSYSFYKCIICKKKGKKVPLWIEANNCNKLYSVTNLPGSTSPSYENGQVLTLLSSAITKEMGTISGQPIFYLLPSVVCIGPTKKCVVYNLEEWQANSWNYLQTLIINTDLFFYRQHQIKIISLFFLIDIWSDKINFSFKWAKISKDLYLNCQLNLPIETCHIPVIGLPLQHLKKHHTTSVLKPARY